MTVQRIEFALIHGYDADVPRPYAANREIPDWYKAMPVEHEVAGTPTRTVKNCVPFLDAMTCGYIIPLAYDLTVTVDAAGKFLGTASTAGVVFMRKDKE